MVSSYPHAFGPFTILGALGRGGMGEVFRARHEAMPGEVALKLAPAAAQVDPRRRERFLREGQITASLRHPNILRVLSAGFVGERPYLAYFLVEGARTFQEFVQGLELRARIEALRDVARALGYAHGQGVVHRDVKPENVLVDLDGQVLVADFGLASAVGLERLTRSDALLGTPIYIAPELILEGARAGSPRCDVYSLGLMLYWALVEEHPYAGDRAAVFDPRQRVIVPPEQVAAGVPHALSQIALKALALDPADRFEDGDAIGDALQAWLDGEEVRVRVRGDGRLVRGLVGASSLLALVGLGWATSRAGTEPKAPTPQPVASATATPDPGEALERARRETRGAALDRLDALRGANAAVGELRALLEALAATADLSEPDPREAALGDWIVSQHLAKSTWGGHEVSLLQALAASGLRPADRRALEALPASLAFAQLGGQLTGIGYWSSLVALVTLDVEIPFDALFALRAEELAWISDEDPAEASREKVFSGAARALRLMYLTRSGGRYRDALRTVLAAPSSELGPVTRAGCVVLIYLHDEPEGPRAVQELAAAVDWDPESAFARRLYAQALASVGEVAAFRAQAERALGLWELRYVDRASNFWIAQHHLGLGKAAVRAGELDFAVARVPELRRCGYTREAGELEALIAQAQAR